MEHQQPSLNNQSREELNFHLKDEFLTSCITRESTKSRRYSSSNLPSFREEARSFRHSPSISSTASSPGYTSRDLIDPSTYSFTKALKALQTRPGRESLPSMKSVSNGNPLHSKWKEAERYICNPLSGQVPLECLSAKTLSGRYLGNSGRIATSAPLGFSHSRAAKDRLNIANEGEPTVFTELERWNRIGSKRILTRDVGTQSSPQHQSSSSNSPESAPPIIKEITVTSCEIEEATPSFQVELKPKEYEVAGNEMQEDPDEKRGERNEMFICKLGSCLGWGPRVKKSAKRR